MVTCVPSTTSSATTPLVRHVGALVLGAVAPGFRQWLDGRRLFGGTLGGVALAAAAVAVTLGVSWRTTVASETALAVMLASTVVLVLMSVVSVGDTLMYDVWWDAPQVWRKAVISTVVAALLTPSVLASGALVWFGSGQLAIARNSLVDAPVAYPSRSADQLVDPEPAAATERLGPDDRSVVGVLGADRFNVLLVGSDGGPGRWMERADSMNVVSLDVESGTVALIGIPRNLYGAPVPIGFEERFPDGFDDLLNAAVVWGELNADSVRDTLGPTEAPGASFLAGIVAELTGLRIDAFAMVDMAGFIDVVDAVGGVEIHVPAATPAPGNVPSGKHALPGVFRAGRQAMDGTDALGYVRSRSGDSDYQRMARQRCVLLSLAAQHGPATIARAWPGLSAAIASSLRTNLDIEQIMALRAYSGIDPSKVVAVSLTPPLVPQRGFDVAAIRAIVDTTLGGTTSSVEDLTVGIDGGVKSSTTTPVSTFSTCQARR